MVCVQGHGVAALQHTYSRPGRTELAKHLTGFSPSLQEQRLRVSRSLQMSALTLGSSCALGYPSETSHSCVSFCRQLLEVCCSVSGAHQPPELPCLCAESRGQVRPFARRERLSAAADRALSCCLLRIAPLRAALFKAAVPQASTHRA